MITRITLVDDEVGEFNYERQPGDRWFHWDVFYPKGDGTRGAKGRDDLEGNDLLYEVALAVTKGKDDA